MKLPPLLFFSLAVAGAALAPDPAAAQPCGQGTPIAFRAGLADAFAAPTDPTSRGTALDAAFPGAAWEDFDDFTPNRFVGHTFTGLPAAIVRAELELRLEPDNDAPENDSVSVGLLPGPRFASTFPIASLPEANGSWHWDSNGPTTFKIALNDAALLSQMSTQQVLDVLVQDDTAVDSMTLRVWVCPRPVPTSGLPNLVRGHSIANQLTDGSVVVSNPGPDFGGISAQLGSARGVCVNLLEPICLGVGTAIDLAASGQIANQVSSSHLKLTYNPQTGLVDITANFPPPLDCSKPEVLNGTSVTRIGFCESFSQVIASVPPAACIKEVDWIVWDDVHAGFSLLFEPGTHVTLGSGLGTVFGDRIRIEPSVFLGGDDGYGKLRLSELALETQGVPSFTIDAEKVQSFGLFHRALGQASFVGTDSGLTLSTPGADGEDGVAIDLPASTGASVALAPLDPLGAAPDGAFLQAELTGSVNGKTKQPLGRVKAVHRVKAGVDQLEMTPDFSALGASTHRVEVYNHGIRVAAAGRQNGTVILGINIIVIWPVALAAPPGGGFALTWPASGAFSLAGGPAVMGDELRLVPETSPSITIDNISGLALRVAGLPELTLTGAQTTPCPLPVIQSQPANVDTAAGRPTQFSVAVLSATPVTYRWRHNGLDLAEGNRYSGTATGILTLSPTILAQAGTYDVVVQNACGAVESAPATYNPAVALRSLLLALVARVQALEKAGTLSAQQRAGLSASLLHALGFLRAGDLPATTNRVDVFLFRVSAFVRAGALSPSQGKALTDAALVIRTRLTE